MTTRSEKRTAMPAASSLEEEHDEAVDRRARIREELSRGQRERLKQYRSRTGNKSPNTKTLEEVACTCGVGNGPWHKSPCLRYFWLRKHPVEQEQLVRLAAERGDLTPPPHGNMSRFLLWQKYADEQFEK